MDASLTDPKFQFMQERVSFMYDFGLTLKKYRTIRKMTLKSLSTRIGVAESTISRYESNEIFPQVETLRSLSAALGVSLDELCGTVARETASLYGLTEGQSELIRNLIEEFRNHNEAFKKETTSKQFELLGKIVAEFSK